MWFVNWSNEQVTSTNITVNSNCIITVLDELFLGGGGGGLTRMISGLIHQHYSLPKKASLQIHFLSTLTIWMCF